MKNLLTLILGTIPNFLFSQNNDAPNIVLFLCDDMGFSDLGCYGSEINTPNIDSLAENGIKFMNFKNCGRSCPSRASLLTGRYQHQVGMGWMTAVDEHREGYRGQISNKYPTIAEILNKSGYKTYMSGKWHLTVDGSLDKPNGSFPCQRGFDRYYGCVHGGGSYFKPVPLYNDLVKIDTVPDDYYYTKAISDSAVSFIKNHNPNSPMFLYVAHYAPHLPLEAPEEFISKNIDKYSVGYDVLRVKRFEKQKRLGLVKSSISLPVFEKEFDGNRPKWDDLDSLQRQEWTRKMATYAAMIEIMDEGVGKVVKAIKDKGILENTIFIFLSDNGASDEGGYMGRLMADLSNTPFRNYKKSCYLGGVSSPLIITFGDLSLKKKESNICYQMAHIIDILPTCIDLASVEYINKDQLPGESLLPILKNGIIKNRTLYFEHRSSCSIIDGKWKLVRADKKSKWELFDLSVDPFETMDLSDHYDRKVILLEKKWNDWAYKNNVFPLEDMRWKYRIPYYKSKNSDQDGID